MLSKLQLSCSKRYLDALLKKFDRNGHGVVEFEELLSFLTSSPYK
jgi:Ca2+-binding EF-hand superfamily protein